MTCNHADPDNTGQCIKCGIIHACIEWDGARSSNGYGRRGKQYAHRLAYAQAHGPIPPGLDVCHSCDNRACVNVDHLFLGTRSDNMRDAAAKGRIRGGGHRKFDRDEARRLLGEGLSLREVGRRLGVTHGCLAKALERDSASILGIR